MLIAWVVFPLVLALLSLGCGLLVARLVPLDVPGALLAPLGFAAVSVIGQFALLGGSATISLAAPVAVACAVAGFGLSLPLRLPRRPWWAIAMLAVFVVFAAPFVLSGTTTFGGYIKLDDTATYLAMLDRAMHYGYDVGGLPPSTYQATLATSLGYGYPLGSLAPLGIGRELVRQDLAWLWQPYLAFLAALLAATLYQLTAGVVRSARVRAFVAFVAAQAALLYGYALWGGVKELAVAVLVGLLAFFSVEAVRTDRGELAVVPAALTAAALVGSLSVGGSVWLTLPLVALLVIAVRAGGWAFAARRAAVLAGCALVLGVPALVLSVEWLGRSGAFTSSDELGNLLHPLSRLEVFGVWPAGDFRVTPHRHDVVRVLVAVVAVAAVVAVVVAARRKAWPFVIALATSALACVVYVGAGSPWIGGKALASASPFVLAAGLAGAAATFEAGRRVEASVAGGVIVVGVLWSNALQYRAVDLAPHARLAELARIGSSFAGDGPTLMTEYESYGARHFLRSLSPEAATELRRRIVRLRTGGIAATGESPDIDELALSSILPYRTLVLRRSGLASRPPSAYSPVWSGRTYQVWQREAGRSRIIEHLSLGDRYQPAAVPRCADVVRLARRAAAAHGVLATVFRPRAVLLEADGSRGPPRSFGAYGEPSGALYLSRPFASTSALELPAGGTYGVWVGGSFKGTVEVDVDGRRVGAARDRLNWPGTFSPLGSVRLPAGRHTLQFRYAGASWRPGSGGEPPFGVGPIALSRATDDRRVTYVNPADAESLCGRSLDWVEALRG
ncbi:MAG TPA: hypothetical protein VLK36_03605 [Gaiellaceae bacterium]|nr:hypothetical protein [Gaiellaceae bacterium]